VYMKSEGAHLYTHELSPADDCRPPFLAPGTSVLKLSRSEASSARGPNN
jgi:hypothetical protein